MTTRRRESRIGRLALGAGGHQPQQQVAELRALLGVELAVHGLGGLRDRAADPAGGLVAVDGEGPPFAALPRLQQRVGQQREGAGLVLDLADQQVDEPGFDHEPGLAGRCFDGGAQVLC